MLLCPKAVILILNYNSIDFLRPIVYSSIESALNVNYPKLDVVVVDNCSTDGSFEAIEDRFGKDIIALKLKRNYGYSGGNEFGFQNYAAKKGLPEYAVFVNNDYIIKNKDFVREHVCFLEAQKNILLANGYNLQEDGVHISNFGFFIDSFTDIIPRYYNFKVSEYPAKVSYITYASGECFVAKIKPILKLRKNIFSPKIFAYWDESELALNLWSYGFRSAALPTEVGIHYGSKSFSKFSNLGLYLATRNRHAIIKSYFRGKLKIYSKPATYRFLLTIPTRPLQATKGKILAKAFFDSHKIIFHSFGKFYPAIIVPKKFSTYIKHATPFPRRVYEELFNKISLMTIGDRELKSSPIPFAIPVNL
ncbi:MAG: glycosyltransferase family 2 protein [Nitrososphaeria archaeon]